ncbi:MAG: hypothetical protein EXR57_02745 [Dehalococcoidia bacterium]|nr:hypothetical protein [Dehalococcoidia bacterium]MSQ34720.1 hypothetical protein [Dehalococcoidia bacterium]
MRGGSQRPASMRVLPQWFPRHGPADPRITLAEIILWPSGGHLSKTESRCELLKRLLISILPVLALFAAVVGHWPSRSASAHYDASPAPDIRVLQQSHRIFFGKEILVTVKAQSDAGEIVGVTARYRPRGPDRISVYGYPSFTPGPAITATFNIKTGEGAYFPPGTDFDIYFELSDSSGNVTQTDTQTIEYLDPAYKWKRMSRRTLTAVYHNMPDDRVARLLDDASEELPHLARFTGAPADQPYKAVLFKTVSDASSSFPRVSEAATDRQFFAGFAQPEYGLFVLGAPEEGSFKHELTHMLVEAAVTSPLAAQMPAWLNEGMAVWSEGDGLASLNSRIGQAARDGRLLRIRSMGTVPATGPEIALFYPESGAFVGYLYARFGPDGLAALLRAMNEGRRVHDATRQAWDVSLDDVENDWRLSLGAAPLPTPRLTRVHASPFAQGATGTTPPAILPSPTAGPASAPVSTDLPIGTPRSAPMGTSIVSSPASSAPPVDSSGFPAWALVLAVVTTFAAALTGRWAILSRRGRGN